MGLINDCSTCYEIVLPECGETLTIKAGLTPNTDYSYTIVDKFDNAYQKFFTTDSNGAFIVDYNDFPDGYFTRFSGTFNLMVMRSNAYCEQSSLTFCGNQYDCLSFSFTARQLWGIDSSSFTVQNDFVINGVN